MEESQVPTLQDYIDRLQEHYDTEGHVDTRWYVRIVNDCNAYLPSTLRHTPMTEIDPQMLQEAINRVCRLGGKRYQSIVSGIRACFGLAVLDDVITTNPALSVHIREVGSTSSALDDEQYGQLLKQIEQVPGGYLFGLAGFADATMKGISLVTREACDPHDHTLVIRRGRRDRVARIADPDGIALFDRAIALYERRMEEPDYARNNSQHLLCTNRFGAPYEERQFGTIVGLLRDACNNPGVDIFSFRRHIRYRQL